MTMLEWVVVGGESGPGARPMHPDWARSLRDQCQAAGVPFFFKQWGEWSPRFAAVRKQCLVGLGGGRLALPFKASDVKPELLPAVNTWRVGKKRAGRELDGREWNEFPEVRA